ncbi:carbamate kinase [Pseudactinotalea sp. Z1748]|uniref:carbamate kinase n=1 Tax=Pseudactinotalea sp. Z1748 TaxID=3413027 RepID=UPI003C7E3AF7
MRALIALGGNAMTSSTGEATVAAQEAALGTAAERIADLVARGVDVVITHGNGPQVGNLLVKNELAADVVPIVPLDWCGAQTQGTIGYTLTKRLDEAFARRGLDRRSASVVTRALVDADDPGFTTPTKPIGRFLPEAQARRFIAEGQNWQDMGERGWRRVVASPEPREILDAPAVLNLVRAGFVTVAAGGGGIPVVREDGGALLGVEAVIDKDLAAALLGVLVEADVLLIATDVEHAIVGYATPQARPLGTIDVAELTAFAAEGHFAAGSMGPKVEAALRFARSGGRSVITSLDHIVEAVEGRVGTQVTAAPQPAHAEPHQSRP